MFSKYNPPIRTFPHIPAATRLRGAEQEPNCEIENPESQSKVRDVRYDLPGNLFGYIFRRDLGTTQSIEPQNPTRLGLPILPFQG